MNNPSLSQPAGTAHLFLDSDEHHLPEFFHLLQAGFSLTTELIGQSVRTFLQGQLALPDDYIKQRISTIFLDSMPVDDLDTAFLQNGSRLALSSAMPGLVGATMRQGSPLAALRNTISYTSSGTGEGGEGIVCLKLFNLVMSDIGQHVLRTGILVQAGALRTFLKEHPVLLNCCSLIQFNGRLLAPDACTDEIMSTGAELVMLEVSCSGSVSS
jgi:hypothetical protein